MSTDSTTTVPEFVSRHIGPREDDVTRMLEVIGQPSVEELIARTAPAAILGGPSLALEGAPTEQAVTDELRAIADRNQVKTSLIGLGYYGTVTPPVVRRNVLENPAWYTAYTPYQPEISQGRLEALLNFQTMVNDLTGLDIANSSLLDEGTAAAEAMTLMRRSSKAAKDAVLLVDEQVLPQSYAVIASRALPLGIQVERLDLSSVTTAEGLVEASGGKGVFGVLVQYPGADGEVRDWRALAEAAHEAKALVTAATDLLALTLLTPPGEWGADIAVGNSQRFGVPMGFGGPHAGFMSVRKGLERSMPGRLVGVSVDEVGAPAYRLALQTREQHIRREKATSNICTAQVLLAVMASMYAVWHGPEGLRRIAERVQRHTAAARQALVAASVDVRTQHHFDTLTVSVPGRADAVMAAALERDLNLWRVDADTVQLSFDETTDRAQVAAVVESFGASFSGAVPGDLAPSWPEALTRTSEYLTHPVFSAHHSETAMMRYLRRLADQDYALDRGMIPLGSCTMKLNATTELEPITWPEFSSLHPFVPTDQSAGSRQIVSDLQQWLVEITGYDAVSMQPNSGASGELAGLMAIRAYHRANGQEERNVCLIPSSAHGTNAASAVMAGFKVVVVKSTAGGSVDMEDLRGKVKEHCEVLAAIMVTYPSTHGVYEDTIVELCELVHEAGGQVYVDGANMNALVGVARPGKFGADVSHLNLHKTFCIPHGGGGPGVGPIGVRSHLAPYLPNHPLAPEAGPDTATGPAASAPYGSASILPISWAYIRLMGGEGLRRATLAAVLNANYVAARLRDHYPVLYSQDGLVAHECILDLRGISHDTGVTVDDVAKRLIDYGFHAPTMSFPVAGTLMVEPTESEDLVELDRFCDAMIAIKTEIDQVGSGEVVADASVLRHAPYTAESLAGDWDYGFDRRTAAFPAGVDPRSKYWPSVRRIDGAYGDRNLICTCPPPEAFADND